MNLVIPEVGAKHEPMFNKPASALLGAFIEHLIGTWAAPLDVAKFITMFVMNSLTPM